MGLFKKPYKSFETYEDWSDFHDKIRAESIERYDKYEKDLKKRLEKEYKQRYDDQEKASERVKKENADLKLKLNDTEIRVNILEEERDEVRDVVRKGIENDDRESALEERKESQDRREARLLDREEKIGKEEKGEYQKGYADGVADGVRKINEITQADRDNAMKIAMVAASSHTPVANMKEALSASRQLTQGTTDPEDE